MWGQPLKLNDGTVVDIIHPGLHNNNSGPDFMNAKLRVGGQLWAGNVEIHVKASDWYRHGHDKDPAYDSIILHSVGIDDAKVNRSNGEKIPQAVIAMPEKFFRTLSTLQTDIDAVRCASRLCDISPLEKNDWIDSLGIERMQLKAARVYEYVEQEHGDWQRGVFLTLARALGFGLNAQPFEMLARTLPSNYLGRHSDDRFQLEALLFGQAGMLDTSRNIFDEYYQQLCREYYFLARKYGLRPMRGDLWKYARTRPQNFPHRRIAMLAEILTGGFSLMSALLECRKPEDFYRLFSWELKGYWLTHPGFGLDAGAMPERLSRASMDLLIINFAAPVIYAYYSTHGNPDRAEMAVDLLQQLRPESNTIIGKWHQSGLECCNAFESQALLHLRKEYCDTQKCLYCRFGHKLLRNSVVLG